MSVKITEIRVHNQGSWGSLPGRSIPIRVGDIAQIKSKDSEFQMIVQKIQFQGHHDRMVLVGFLYEEGPKSKTGRGVPVAANPEDVTSISMGTFRG